jgi:hypothetical protein
MTNLISVCRLGILGRGLGPWVERRLVEGLSYGEEAQRN